MKKILLLSVSALLMGCATTQTVASKIEDMERRPNGTYCVIEGSSGATVLTNRLALDAFYQSRSLPTCELLYETHYDFQAPTAREQLSALQQRIEQLEAHLNESKE